MSEEIEEAQILSEETGVILKSEFATPELPIIVDKESALELIKKAREKYEKISVDGTKDKANYKLVVAGIKELKDSRLAYVKSVKENVISPADTWLKGIKSDIGEIEQEFKDGEEALRKEKDRVDTLKFEEAQAEENRKIALMGQRIEILVGLGGKQSNNQYVFDYDMALFVTTAQMKDSDDKQWEVILKDVQKSFDTEAKRLDDIKTADELAKQKLQEELNKANEERAEMRKEVLEAKGFVYSADEDSWNRDGTEIYNSLVLKATQEEWKAIFIPVAAKAEPVKTEQPIVNETPTESTTSAIRPSQSFIEKAPVSKFVMPDISNVVPDKGIEVPISLLFTEERPYVSFAVGNFAYRIYPVELAENAMKDIDAEFILASELINENQGLQVSAFKKV